MFSSKKLHQLDTRKEFLQHLVKEFRDTKNDGSFQILSIPCYIKLTKKKKRY